MCWGTNRQVKRLRSSPLVLRLSPHTFAHSLTFLQLSSPGTFSVGQFGAGSVGNTVQGPTIVRGAYNSSSYTVREAGKLWAGMQQYPPTTTHTFVRVRARMHAWGYPSCMHSHWEREGHMHWGRGGHSLPTSPYPHCLTPPPEQYTDLNINVACDEYQTYTVAANDVMVPPPPPPSPPPPSPPPTSPPPPA